MNSGIQIGPLAVPYTLLLVLGATGAAISVGRVLGKTSARQVESLLSQALVVGFVVARLAFVWQFSQVYLAAPLGILDIRDGGWTPLAGFIGAGLFAFARVNLGSQAGIRKPLWAALASGAVVWGLGTFALTVERVDGPRLPPLALVSLQGAPVKLTDFQGKPTVVNLWATWCPPCVREMPVLHQAQVAHPSVNFVFVNAGESPQLVQRWLESRNLPLKNVLLDTKKEAAAEFKAPGFPTTLFFDAEGRLVSVRMGELSLATLNERLGAL